MNGTIQASMKSSNIARFWIFGFVLFGSVLGGAKTRNFDPQNSDFQSKGAKIVGTLSDARLLESSGLAASRRFPNFFWTHNDSGDSPRLFLLNARGQTVLVVHLKGANAVDWEDIAVAGSKENAQVYIGDIGDNKSRRASIVVYRFAEAQVPLNAISSTRTDADAPEIEVVAGKMTLRYPDGAHDAETLIATRSGSLILVTKTRGVSQIFQTPRVFADATTQVLSEIGRFSFGGAGIFTQMTTGGDLSADEKRVVVRTYSSAYEWVLPVEKNAWREVWKSAPRVVDLPVQPQGEAICYALDGRSWRLSSEGAASSLWQVARG